MPHLYRVVSRHQRESLAALIGLTRQDLLNRYSPHCLAQVVGQLQVGWGHQRRK